MRSVAFDLLWRRDGTEDDLCETLTGKHAETNAADGSSVFDQRQSSVFAEQKPKIMLKIHIIQFIQS